MQPASRCTAPQCDACVLCSEPDLDPAIHLAVSAIIPGATQEQLTQAAEKTKVGCPVSKVLNAKITMEATLKNT